MLKERFVVYSISKYTLQHYEPTRQFQSWIMANLGQSEHNIHNHDRIRCKKMVALSPDQLVRMTYLKVIIRACPQHL